MWPGDEASIRETTKLLKAKRKHEARRVGEQREARRVGGQRRAVSLVSLPLGD